MKTLTLLSAAMLLFPAMLVAQSGSCCESTKTLTSMPVSQDGKTIVETAIGAGQFKTLVAAVKAAGLVDTLSSKGPFTVFAPTDAAFAKLPKGTVANLLKPENKQLLANILTFHVVSGAVPASKVVKSATLASVYGQRLNLKVGDGGVSVQNASVVKTDIGCSNGIIHVIDTVMLPASKNIVEVAQGAGKFNTLVKAALAAGLAPTLADGGPFTVFAPTDKAFGKLPEGTIASLLMPENKEKLAGILKYHVVSGRVYSPAAVKAGHATTLQGAPIKVSVKDGVARINNAKLVATDVEASNGVVHIIDTVLLPK